MSDTGAGGCGAQPETCEIITRNAPRHSHVAKTGLPQDFSRNALKSFMLPMAPDKIDHCDNILDLKIYE
jgi:hypothetical protein